MSFLASTDYDAGIYSEILTAITRGNPAVQADAESAAVSEMKSYLNSRYDTAAIFAATGANRSDIIVMFCRDMAIYHMHIMSNPRQLPQIRQTRYEAAIDWLKQVSRQKINPDLPVLSDGSKDYILSGGNTKRESHF